MKIQNIFYMVLILMAIIDYQKKVIPPIIPLIIVCFTPFLSNWTNWTLLSGSIGFLLGGAVLLIPSMIHTGAFGGGDIKLSAALGLALGYRAVILGLFLSCAFSLPAVCICKLKGKSHLAFGPYLCMGFLLACQIAF